MHTYLYPYIDYVCVCVCVCVCIEGGAGRDGERGLEANPGSDLDGFQYSCIFRCRYFAWRSAPSFLEWLGRSSPNLKPGTV